MSKLASDILTVLSAWISGHDYVERYYADDDTRVVAQRMAVECNRPTVF